LVLTGSEMSLSNMSSAMALMLAQSISLEQWKWGDVTVQKHFNTETPSVREINSP